MSTTAIFLLTDPQHLVSLPSITERLRKHCNPGPPERWQVDYRLLRSTASPSFADDKAQPRFQDVLHLSHHGQKAFVAVDGHGAAKSNPANDTSGKAAMATASGMADTVITIPLSQRDQFYDLIKTKMGALWTPRMTLQVLNGAAFEAGDYIVRMGELKQVGSQQIIRGVVVCIQSKPSPEQDNETVDKMKVDDSTTHGQDESTKVRRDAVRDFWKKFGVVEGTKEAFCASQPGDDGFAEVRLWCSVLRLRI